MALKFKKGESMKKFCLFLYIILTIFVFSEDFPVSPYVNPDFIKKIPWPKQSFYLQSWRSYMETIKGKDFLEGIGIGYNFPWNGDYETALKFLSESGFKNIRIEIGWSNVPWDENKLNNEEGFINVFKACKKYGIKPLILLNAHHGVPCPNKSFKRKVISGGTKGSREIILNDVSDLVPHYSGLSNLTGYIMNEVFITKIDPETKKVELSRPLPREIKDGEEVIISTMKYLPAHPVETKEFEEMADGWMKYVKLVCDTVKKAGLSDNEFEIEIWNELSFGSMFMGGWGINHYYDPPKVKFSEDFLHKGGHAWEIGKRTVDYIKENYPNTRVIWGFSNTTFYHTPIQLLPPKMDGQSYHPYGTGKRIIPKDYPPKDRYSWYIEGYIPENLIWCMPEGWAHLGVQTENLIRHLYPEYRKSKPEGVNRFYHYMTEHGFNAYEAGISDEKDALEYKVKSIIRALLFWINKGISKVYIFCAYDRDNRGYGILPSNINPKEYSKYSFEEISTPAMKALKNVVDKFKDSEDLKDVRQIDIDVISIDEKQPKVFEGDQNHPPLYYRDMFTFLPFQIKNNKFICAYYVMSYDITNPPGPMNFRVKIKNIYGENSNISFYDPIKDKELQFKITKRDKNFVELEIEAVEYPRLIIIEEKANPVSINNFKIKDIGDKYVLMNVSTNVPSIFSVDYYLYNTKNKINSKSYSKEANIKIDNLLPGQKYEFTITAEDKNGIKITSPSYLWEDRYTFKTEENPNEPPVGLKTEYYISNKNGEFSNLKKTEISPLVFIDNRVLNEKTGQSEMVAVRYSGEIYIDKDDKYTFYTVSDDGIRVKIDEKMIINNWTDHGATEDKGEIELSKGWHKILIEYYQGVGGTILEFYYSRSDLEKTVVPAVYLRTEKKE